MAATTASRPMSVTLAALCLALLALWQLAVKAGPALAVSHPSALQELLSVALTAYVVWGVFALKPWARWLGLIFTGVGAAFSLGILGAFEELQQNSPLADPAAVSRTLTVLGAVCIVGFLALLAPSSRTAFNGR